MDALSLINPDVAASLSRWREAFASAQPFRHVVIEGFLRPEVAQSLISTFPAFESGNCIGDDGQPGGKSTVEGIRRLGGVYEQLDEAVQSTAFLTWLGELTGIPGLLYDPFYLGGGTHENRHGQSLSAHIDFNYHPSERWHRRLNLIVYLNDGWRPEWGGALELYRDPYQDTQPAHVLSPIFNRCVIFETTEHSWHAFNRIDLPEPLRATTGRKSVALYFYSKDRPVEETAGRHTTHYVQQQLPDRFQPGHELDADDVRLLRELLAHRDGQLKTQYDEIARLLQAQDRGLTGKLLYLAKRLYVRSRRR